MRFNYWQRLLAIGTLFSLATTSYATPYASNVNVSGTTVTFILNEPADILTYSLNGGGPVAMPDGLAKGSHTFTLGAASDTFSIVAEKTAATGWTIPTGGTLPAATGGLSRISNAAGLNLISDDTSTFSKYVTPRGVGVNMNPNTANFGTVYIANGGAGTSGGRTIGDGMYAIRADQTDAFGYGDTAQNPNSDYDGFPLFITASNNSPYHVTVAPNGEVYVADWADANSNADVLSANLTTGRNLFDGYNGTFTTAGPDGTSLPAAQNHGSIPAIFVTGSSAGGNLVVYTMDEDLNSAHATGVNTNPQSDRNSVWKYTIGTLPSAPGTPYTGMPTKVAGGLIGTVPAGGVVVDFDFSPDMSKVYMTQNRSAGTEAGLLVADASNGTILFDSLANSKTFSGAGSINTPADYNQDGIVNSADYVIWRSGVATLPNEVPATTPATNTIEDYNAWRARFGNANDILTTVQQVAVSPDGKWLALMLNGSDVAVVPLVNGIPDLANRMVVDSSNPNVNTARDITFDAAGNIHYVSSGQALYKQLSPGGHTLTTLTWNGSTYSFSSTTIPGSGLGAAVPEPGTIGLVMCGLLALGALRRR